MSVAATVAVYGGTPCGILGAIAAAREGANTVLIEPRRHLGGHSTSGIDTSEVEHMLPESFMGPHSEFYWRLAASYGLKGCMHRWQPHRAEAIYHDMLEEAGVDVRLGLQLTSVDKSGTTLQALHFEDGSVVTAEQFIDASYEGDLMAFAGVSYTWGRESIDEYGESLAGVRYIDDVSEVANTKGHALHYDAIHEVDLKRADGSWIPWVEPTPAPELGSGDRRVANYHHRLTISTAADRIPIEAPEGYDPGEYELLARWLHKHPQADRQAVIGRMNFPSGQYAITAKGDTKVTSGETWELNNHQGGNICIGYLGANVGYPDGTPAERAVIEEAHKRHLLGYLYFLQNEAGVPAGLREEIADWGLPASEYVDNGHYPYQMYVREARRMIGQRVMTQGDILQPDPTPDAIYYNSHWIDCHHVQRVALDDHHYRNEGRIWVEVTTPYPVPYSAFLPKAEEATNLLVPGCLSSSHVAFCSLRLESSWMAMGYVAGLAATRAISHPSDNTVHAVDTDGLRTTLRERGFYFPEST